MSLIERAWLYVTRKKGRTIVMFAIFFVMATAIISGISIKKAAQTAMQQARESVGGYFSLNINYDESNPNIKREETKNEFGSGITMDNNGDPITGDILNQIGAVDGIKYYNGNAIVSLDDNGLKYVEVPKNDTPGSMTISGDYDLPNFQMSVNMNSQLDSAFQNGLIKLVEGNHITAEDKNKILIHKDLAEKNGLKVGDKIKLKMQAQVVKEMGIHENEVEVEIGGIFENAENSQEMPAYLPFMMMENKIIADEETGRTLMDSEVFAFDTAVFYVKDPKDMQRIVEEVKKLDLDWQQFAIDTNDAQYQQIAGSIENLDQVITVIIYAVLIVSGIILTLILTLWIKGRVYETGVLLSLGIPKIKIIGQYVTELLMIAILAFGLSYFSGRALSQSISDTMMETMQAQKDNHQLGSSISITGGVINGMEEEIKELDISVSAQELLGVYLIGGTLIILSVMVSSASILKLNPKEILSKMS